MGDPGVRKTTLLYIIVIVVTLGYRLYPAVASREPFSIDAWPLLYDAKTIQASTPIPLEDGRLDGYNSFWPGSIFTSVITASVLNVDVEALMALIYPLVNGLGTALYIYLIGRRVGDHRVGLAAALLAGIMFPAFFVGAGVTKETYAYTLYLILIYLSLSSRGWVGIPPMLLVASGLVLAHHLTTFMAFASLLTIGTLYLIRLRRIGVAPVMAAAALFILGYLHYNVLGYLGLRLPELLPETLVSIASYLVVFLFLGNIHPGEARRGARLALNTILLVSTLSTLTFIILVLGVSMEVVKLGAEYLPYTLQYILLGALAYLATTRLGGDELGKGIYYWFLGVSWIIVYSLFGGNPFFINIIYRFIEFMIPPLAILAAYSLMRTSTRVGAVGLAITVIIVGISSTYMLVGAFHLGDPYLGYNWRNRVAIVQPGIHLRSFTEPSIVALYGDTTIKYIYKEYYGFRVYTQPTYLNNAKSTGKDLVMLYREMLINGFNQGPYKLIRVEEIHLRKNLNRIYDNNQLWIYA